MDLNSYIQLKEAYLQVGKPQQLTESVDSIWEEVEAFAHALVEEEGIDLSDMTWDEVREAYMSENFFGANIGKDEEKIKADAAAKAEKRRQKVERDRAIQQAGGGAAGEAERKAGKEAQISKEFPAGTYKSSDERRRTSAQAVDVDAKFRTRKTGEANLRRLGDGDLEAGLTKFKAQQAAAKAAAAKKKAEESKPKPDPTPDPDPKPTNNAPVPKPTNNAPAPKPAAPVRSKQTGDKAKDMATWAKANPKLAAAKAERDRTRGTNQTTNPLMKDMKSRLPAPSAPKPSAPKPSAPKPSADSSQMRAMSKPSAPSGGAKAAASTSGPKFNPAASRIAMGGNKVTTKPSTGAKAAMAAASSSGSKFNPNAPKIKLNNSVEMSEFDLVLEHLVDQGFGPDEALKLMVNMSEEKREEILAAEGYKGKHGQSDKEHMDSRSDAAKQISGDSKSSGAEYSHRSYRGVGKPAEPGKRQEHQGKMTDADRNELAIRKNALKKDAEKKKTQKEETDSLYQAYLSMMSEEESDKRKDKELETKGVDAKVDYSKPPATGNTFGKKKPMSDEDRSAAMAKIVAKLKKQGGK